VVLTKTNTPPPLPERGESDVRVGRGDLVGDGTTRVGVAVTVANLVTSVGGNIVCVDVNFGISVGGWLRTSGEASFAVEDVQATRQRENPINARRYFRTIMT
jgi:hypothetical protein